MFRGCCCNNNRQMMGYGMPNFQNGPMMEQQVVEPTINKCEEKEFYHEVPQV